MATEDDSIAPASAANDFLSPVRAPVSLETIISSSSSPEEDTDVNIVLGLLAAMPLAIPHPQSDDTKMFPLKIPEEMKSEAESMFYCLEYMSEIHSHLKATESDAVFPVDSGVLSKQSYMLNCHRSVLVNWLIEVQERFKLSHDTLYIAINLMDQYLKLRDVTRNEIQLVGVTSLFIASKFEEMNPPQISDFVYISANAYTKPVILAQELDILGTTNYRLSLPFSLQFLCQYAKVGGASDMEHTMAMYILEHSLLECSFMSINPSLRAAAALNLARSLLREPSEDPPSQQHHNQGENEACSFYTEEELSEVKRMFLGCLAQYRKHQLSSIRTKYKKRLYLSVADHPSLDSLN